MPSSPLKPSSRRTSADIFGEAKPLLSDWIKELNRDEIIAALMALPSESQPAAGVRVNGIQYDLATTAQRNTWQTDNADRILYGAVTTNLSAGNHATSLLNVDTTADKFTAANLSLLKRVAMNAIPKIRPYTTKNGYEYYVCFAGINSFRDLKLDLAVTNKDARPRETMGSDGAPNNPLFQDGDQIYDGVIVPLGAGNLVFRHQRLDLAENRGHRIGPRRAGVPLRPAGGGVCHRSDGQAHVPAGRRLRLHQGRRHRDGLRHRQDVQEASQGRHRAQAMGRGHRLLRLGV